MSFSYRSQSFLGNHALEYIGKNFSFVSNNNCYSDTNINGGMPLAIAENNLMKEELTDKINSIRQYSPGILNYTESSGLPKLKDAIANFFSKRIFRLNFESSQVSPSQLILGAGCTAILHELSLLLLDRDDSVLIPVPYYPAFQVDFCSLTDAVIVEVRSLDGSMLTQLSIEILEDAFNRSLASNHTPKALVLTNPHNPLGIVYSRESILLACGWCRERKIHLICDEVYALSVFDDKSSERTNSGNDSIVGAIEPFVSAAKLLNNELGDYVHIVWSFSKDFGASGLRLGVLYSQNSELITAMTNLNNVATVSNLFQECACFILEDEEYLNYYITKNRRLLYESYLVITQGLHSLGIAYVEAVGGIFVFADFSKFMDENSLEGEAKLSRLLCDEYKIVLTPGSACHCPFPGYFRICYAWVTISSLRETIRRLEGLVQRKSA
jgi:1-aminocyclopropane-1-carboxylate synthase